jgi:hypothetical protein
MANKIALPDTEYLPPELLLDEHHPANSSFMNALRGVQRMIVTVSQRMTPWHIDAVKLKLDGHSHVEIANKLNRSAQGVGGALARNDAQELRAVLQHYNIAMAGPNDAHRRRMLWEIAVDNQKLEPKVSISSIAELNKMNHTYSTGDADKSINIIFNNAILPKGKLDT